jgi:hypothetical protein
MNQDRPPSSNEAPDDTTIWRYMDLPKFVAMLVSNSLWFAKAARLEDSYEAFCEAVLPEILGDDRSPKCVTSLNAEGVTTLISLPQMLRNLSDRSAAYVQNAPECLYVNSWCLADESMAMWEIYGSGGRGVAVKSSVGRYVRAAKFDVRQEQYDFGTVEYDSGPPWMVDLTDGAVPGPSVWKKVLASAFHKRTCFAYEQEWRCALYQDPRPDSHGCNIIFDLGELIDTVYVGPRADKLFLDIVGSLMEKFRLSGSPQRSALLQAPLQRAQFRS